MLVRHGAPANVLSAGYGTTETSFLLTGVEPTNAPVDEAGTIMLGGCAAGVAIRIVDDCGDLLCEGEVGNIEALAPQTAFSFYWGEVEPNQSGFTYDGWWKTGDLGMIRDGSFSFRGRAKHTIVVGGRKLSLTEIDAHLQGDTKISCRTVAFVAREETSATDGLGVALLQRDAEELDSDVLLELIRSSLVRRFGLAPVATLVLQESDVPLTATGKVDRASLSRAATGVPPIAADERPLSVSQTNLLALWCEALDVQDDFDHHATFEALGGDSLRLATLLSGIDARLGIQISLPSFFAAPTFANLLLVSASAPLSADVAADDSAWPLPLLVQRGIQTFLEAWDGKRVTDDRLLLGRNLEGSRPPIFGIFNASHEFNDLANALGEEQPLFAFRSAYEIAKPSENLIQQIALRYVQDVEIASPCGPIFCLGNARADRSLWQWLNIYSAEGETFRC